MIFRDYQDIARQALRLNYYRPDLAAEDIGIGAKTYCDVLTGSNPDASTIYRLLIYMAYRDYQESSKNSGGAV